MAVMAHLWPLQDVAVKVLQLSIGSGDSDRLLKSLKRELAVLMHISHTCDHVARFLGFTIKDGNACIVMRLYPHSLADAIARAEGVVGGGYARSACIMILR